MPNQFLKNRADITRFNKIIKTDVGEQTELVKTLSQISPEFEKGENLVRRENISKTSKKLKPT